MWRNNQQGDWTFCTFIFKCSLLSAPLHQQPSARISLLLLPSLLWCGPAPCLCPAEPSSLSSFSLRLTLSQIYLSIYFIFLRLTDQWVLGRLRLFWWTNIWWLLGAALESGRCVGPFKEEEPVPPPGGCQVHTAPCPVRWPGSWRTTRTFSSASQTTEKRMK